jgi:deoxycytidylate deaminase
MTSVQKNSCTWTIPYLPAGKHIFVVPETDQFMEVAKIVRDTKSTDLNHSTGAIIVKDGVIIGKAANQAGFKKPWLIELHRRGWCVRRLLKIKSGTKYWMCPGCSTHQDHAESGAVKDAITKAGINKTQGADLYLYGHYWCCKPCWDNMLMAGIGDVYVVEGAFEKFGKRK